MTSAQMLARVRTLLDEASAGFYTDAEIYSALSDGQREVTNFGLAKYVGGNVKTLPKILEPLLQIPATGSTVDVQVNYATLPSDFLYDISVKFQKDNTTGDYVPCLKKDLGEEFYHYNDNTYFTETVSVNQFYWIDKVGSKIYFGTSTGTTNTGLYMMTYVSRPTEIASGTEPVLYAFTHEAIVQYAYAFVLEKDMRTQESTVEYQKFQDYLTRLV